MDGWIVGGDIPEGLTMGAPENYDPDDVQIVTVSFWGPGHGVVVVDDGVPTEFEMPWTTEPPDASVFKSDD